MRWYVASGVASLILGGCSGGVSGPPDPTQADAQVAMRLVSGQLGSNVMYGQAGTPTECQSGMMGAQEVRSCKICALHVIAQQGTWGTRALHLQRAIFTVPFKRAIAHDQPDIAPTDDSLGVWVAAVSAPSPFQPPAAPTYVELESKDLNANDLSRIGVTMGQNFDGSLSFSIRRPGYVGVIPNADALLEFLVTSEAGSVMQSIVEGCEPDTATH